MLLNEPVNDFDYYFTNKETVLAVAQYYVDIFNALHPSYDVTVLEHDDGRVELKMSTFEVEKQVMSGINFDATDEIDPDELDLKEDDVVERPKYCPVFLSPNAITLSGKVQLVLRFYGLPEQIHESYDFVHCTNYWTSNDGKLVLNPEALESLLSKHLVYKGSKYPLCSIMRTRKFIKRGWHINAGQYVKMALQLNELDLLDIKTLQDQLVGVDSLYFMQFIEAIKRKQEEDSNFRIENSYLIEVIDRIF